LGSGHQNDPSAHLSSQQDVWESGLSANKLQRLQLQS